MKSESLLAKTIRVTEKQAKYDAQVKKLLANEAILAWILKTCTEEFASCMPEEIIPCIEGSPEISQGAVHPADEDADRKERLTPSDRNLVGGNTEDGSLREQTVYYDIRLNATAPGKIPVCLIINIEAQRDFTPGYPVEKRAIYYCCRLISSQYGTIFTNSEYGKIRKVYSIWFCTQVPERKKNSIQKISLTQEQVFGESISEKENVDLMQAVIVNLGDEDAPVDHRILRLMNVLLSERADAQSKQKVMEEEFHIAMTKELESEVSEMCNLGYGIYENGMKEGRAEGFEEGREEGIGKGIIGSVEILRKVGFDETAIIKHIMEQYELTKEEAENYVFEACAI